MKQHDNEQSARLDTASKRLSDALLALRNREEVASFLSDLCTPAELEAMVDRWRVVLLLEQGLSYRDISDRTGVSVTTIGRVARFKDMGSGGYRTALERLAENR
jgi:TrpR-related protein YerC/YecD